MKTYRQHGCARQHRTWHSLARCMWPRAAWVAGDGPFASVSWCPRGLTVVLHETALGAANAVRTIDAAGCGGRCIGNHEVIRLERSDES